MEVTSKQASGPVKRSRVGTVFWSAAALFVSFITTAVYLPAHVNHMGVKFVFAWVIGTLLGIAGVRIGDALRRAMKPDFIITSGGFQGVLAARIFWSIGPQFVGLLIGAVVGGSTLVGWMA